MFPEGVIDGCPIPSRESAKAVDYIYPAENHVRANIVAQVMGSEDLDIMTLCQIANLAYVIVKNDDQVRNLVAKNLEARKDRQAVAKFATATGFRKVLALAACGQDNGRHASELADMIVVLSQSDLMIADAITRAIITRS